LRTRIGLAASAIVYVAGAVGMEMAGAIYLGARKVDRDLIYILMFTLEETLECSG
jgi:hypothetical protein